VQVLDKARNGQGNPSFFLGRACLDFDGFGWIWVDLAKFGFGLDFCWISFFTHLRNGDNLEFAAGANPG
jgi:hypothetical protein